MKPPNPKKRAKRLPRTRPTQTATTAATASTLKVKYGVPLQGERRDLEDWKEAFPLGGDPWVEIIGVEVVLRSASLDGLVGLPAFVASQQLVRVARGAIAALGRATSVSALKAMLEFRGTRKPVRFEYPEVNWKSIEEITREPLAEIAPPSDPQRWVAAAVHDDDLVDALLLVGGELDWYDIYKVIECLEHKYGGEHKLRALPWAPPSLKRLKKAANWPRHRRRPTDAPIQRIPLKLARKEVTDLVRRALAAETAAAAEC